MRYDAHWHMHTIYNNVSIVVVYIYFFALNRKRMFHKYDC